MATPTRFILVLLGLGACTPGTPATAPQPRPREAALPPISWPGASTSIDTIAPGMVHHAFVVDSAPWSVQLLEIDRAACWSLAQQKAGGAAVGRATTSALLGEAGPRARAAVNADFFLFAPPGVPTGAAITGGRVITGPGTRPVLATGADGAPWIGVLSTEGSASAGGETLPVTGWNRAQPNDLAWFDAGWGESIVADTSRASLRVVLRSGGVVQLVDSSGAALIIPRDGGVLLLGGAAPVASRAALLRLAARGTVAVRVGIEPFLPREAVGGLPVLLRDSAEVAGLETAGGANFAPVRHPRTIVGTAAQGRRILLVVVDGRQPGLSVGMTLRESAALMRALGASEAINLDGGGSSAMVVRGDDGVMRVLNSPSDSGGERAVANALVVVRGCGETAGET